MALDALFDVYLGLSTLITETFNTRLDQYCLAHPESSIIQTTAQFSALRCDPSDDALPYTATSQLNMKHGDFPYRVSKQTLREKLSIFPWRTFLIFLLLPLALSPIIALSATAENASQSCLRGLACYRDGL
jgi:hypothetical protein